MNIYEYLTSNSNSSYKQRSNSRTFTITCGCYFLNVCMFVYRLFGLFVICVDVHVCQF